MAPKAQQKLSFGKSMPLTPSNTPAIELGSPEPEDQSQEQETS